METLLLADVVGNLKRFDDEAAIWVRDRRPTPTSEAVVVPEDGEPPPPPWRYLVEIFLSKEAVEVWHQWRPGHVASIDDMVAAVVHYGVYDDYLPLEGA